MIVTMRGPNETSIQSGQYVAQLLRSKVSGDTTWYVIVQPRESRDIVGIDRFLTFDEARDAAYKTLELLNGNNVKGHIA